MKKWLLLIIAGAILTACSKEQPKKDYAVLSGKIDNFKSRKMTLKGYNYEKDIRFDRKTKTFNDTLLNIVPGHYTLVIGKRPVDIYLSSAEDLKLIVDAKKRTEDPIFEGPNANINNYLSERRKKFGLILGNANKLFALNEDEFLSKMDEYKSSLEDLADASQLPADYLTKEKRNIQYEFARNLNNYQAYHRILYGDDEFVVSDSFPDEVSGIDFNSSEDYINSFSYRNLLKESLDKQANKRKPEDGDFDLTLLETVHTEVTDTLVKNDLIHQIAQKSITYTMNLSEFYKKYMGYSTSDKNKREITNLYDKLKLTAKGQPSPKFENYENYTGGTTSFDDLIGKGKYLYIDVWATWCSYCKKEIPLLKRYEQQYHGKNIEFVSISVDTQDKKKKWRETIEEKEMGGVQLFAGDKQDNIDFAKDYLIKGLPRFIIVDPEGKIVTANAPRPSDGDQLVEMFEDLGI
ncbi:thiol-disulfide isomerase/thioredoxin [Tenacibaculum adriaticum]|uniref:Thiol-disulfide isomerase/thioredoxin n=1 Tax=Tenacibaculum adriaticum TaxID=413713 RepID=A0A5S5DQI4_9FLAO|nr:TlpA disulfide reductase family protein [Tenacibaculum adriaticum]TYP98220.1 thiol-disulfide isomerase/thioredoxin [Tenacibaculum adriaticum]